MLLITTIYYKNKWSLAIRILCTDPKEINTNNQETKENKPDDFDKLDSFFNPQSDLSDLEIFEKIKSHTLASVGVFPEHQPSSLAHPAATLVEYLGRGILGCPITIGEYAEQKKYF